MPKLSPINARKLIKILKKKDFQIVGYRGSHARLVHPKGMRTSVPVHAGEKIGKGLLRKILRDTNISHKEFLRIR